MHEQQASGDTNVIVEQAQKVRALYPELYAFLAARDRRLRLMQLRIPHPEDPESWGSFNLYEHVTSNLRSLAPGMSDLAER